MYEHVYVPACVHTCAPMCIALFLKAEDYCRLTCTCQGEGPRIGRFPFTDTGTNADTNRLTNTDTRSRTNCTTSTAQTVWRSNPSLKPVDC